MATKADLVNSVSNAIGITKTDTLSVVNSVFSELGNLLISDGAVQITDFGKFVAKVTPQRGGRNPRTGVAIVIPAKTRVRFNPFKTLENAVAEARPAPVAAPEPSPTPLPAETPPQEAMKVKEVKVKEAAKQAKPKATAKKAPKKPKVKPIGYKVGKRK